MNRLLPILLGTLLLATTAIGVSAYTTATVERTSNINVAADNNAIIGLTPGSDSAVALNASDEIEINAAQNANGVNPGAVFWYGDKNGPTTTYAFSLTNNDTVSRTFDFEYIANSGSSVSTEATFYVYDSTGTKVGSFYNGTPLTGVTVSSGSTYYVLLKVDTNGLNSTNDLSGTVRISA